MLHDYLEEPVNGVEGVAITNVINEDERIRPPNDVSYVNFTLMQ